MKIQQQKLSKMKHREKKNKKKGIKASVRAQFTQWREDSEKILEEIMIKFFFKFDKNL